MPTAILIVFIWTILGGALALALEVGHVPVSHRLTVVLAVVLGPVVWAYIGGVYLGAALDAAWAALRRGR